MKYAMLVILLVGCSNSELDNIKAKVDNQEKQLLKLKLDLSKEVCYNRYLACRTEGKNRVLCDYLSQQCLESFK